MTSDDFARFATIDPADDPMNKPDWDAIESTLLAAIDQYAQPAHFGYERGRPSDDPRSRARNMWLPAAAASVAVILTVASWIAIRSGEVVQPPTTVTTIVTTTTGTPESTTTTASTTTTTEDPAKPTVEVNGARLAYNCYGSGEPTIVVELPITGSRTRPESWFGLDKFFAIMSETNKVCVYGRRGVAGSDISKVTVTTADQVEDLKGLIDALDLETPVVLAGWAQGAYNIRLFAASYPDYVRGLVFIDGTDPGFDEYDPIVGREEVTERLAFPPSSAQVAAVTDLGDLPIYVLSASRHEDWWLDELQPRLVALSTNSIQEILDADQTFVTINPQPVVDAIKWVIEQSR